MVFLSTTGDVLNATPADRLRVLRRRRRRLRRHPRRRRHRVRLAVVRRPGRAPTSPRTPPSSRRRSGSRTGRTPATSHLGADLDPHRRVVQLPHQPAQRRASAGRTSTSRQLQRRRHGATTRSPGASTTSGGRSCYTGLGHTERVLRRARLPRTAARRHPGTRPGWPRPPTAARRPATRRCSTAPGQPGRGGRRAPAASPSPTAPSPPTGGMGVLWYPVTNLRQLLAEARLDDAGRRQRRRLHRASPTRRRPVDSRSTGVTRSRSTPPTPTRPHHRARLQLQGRPTSPPAPRRSTRPAPGTPMRSLVHGRAASRSSSTAPRSTTTPAPRHIPTATSASRTTAPAWTSTTATSGSSRTARPTRRPATWPGAGRSRPPASSPAARTSRRTRWTATPPPAGAAPTPTRSGSPSTWARTTPQPGPAELGGRPRRAYQVQTSRTTPPGQTVLLHHHLGRRSRRPRPSPGPDATCASYGTQRAHCPPRATRCGTSASTAPRPPRRPRPRCSPPGKPVTT